MLKVLYENSNELSDGESENLTKMFQCKVSISEGRKHRKMKLEKVINHNEEFGVSLSTDMHNEGYINQTNDTNLQKQFCSFYIRNNFNQKYDENEGSKLSTTDTDERDYILNESNNTMETIPDEFPKLNTDSDDINDCLIILKETHHVPPILNSKTKNGIMAQFANKYSTNEHSLCMNRVGSDLTESKQLNHSFLCKPNQTHRCLSQSEKLKIANGDGSPLEREFASPSNLIACLCIQESSAQITPKCKESIIDMDEVGVLLNQFNQPLKLNEEFEENFTDNLQKTNQTSHSLKIDEYRRKMIGSLRYIKSLRKAPTEVLESIFVDLPQRLPHQKKILILDLDETLIHSFKIGKPPINAKLTTYYDEESDSVNYLRFKVRPYTLEFLKEANKNFQVVVFTASKKCYADAILNILDPKKELIHHRLYRENCYPTRGDYLVKDLRIFQNADLKDIIIVDNSIHSYAFQLDNGIPIFDFIKDDDDLEFYHLIPYLNILAECDDVRIMNRKVFKLSDELAKL